LRLRLAGPDLVDAPPDALEAMQAQAARLEPRTAVRWLEHLQRTLAEARGVTDPALLLELAVVDAALAPEAPAAPAQAPPAAPAAATATRPRASASPAPAAPRPDPARAEPIPQSLDATRLRRIWPQVAAHVRETPPADAPDLPRLLQQVRAVGVRDGVVVLRAPSHAVQERLNRPAYRAALDAAWRAVLGREVPWKVEARAARPNPAAPEAHPLLETLRELGGRVSPVNPSDEE